MKTIQVIVVYALPDTQYFFEIRMPKETTVKAAILKSNILKLLKNFSLCNLKVGVYNQLVCLNSKIKDGDRIEIYRNLTIDPKERRRNYLHNIQA